MVGAELAERVREAVERIALPALGEARPSALADVRAALAARLPALLAECDGVAEGAGIEPELALLLSAGSDVSGRLPGYCSLVGPRGPWRTAAGQEPRHPAGARVRAGPGAGGAGRRPGARAPDHGGLSLDRRRRQRGRPRAGQRERGGRRAERRGAARRARGARAAAPRARRRRGGRAARGACHRARSARTCCSRTAAARSRGRPGCPAASRSPRASPRSRRTIRSAPASSTSRWRTIRSAPPATAASPPWSATSSRRRRRRGCDRGAARRRRDGRRGRAVDDRPAAGGRRRAPRQRRHGGACADAAAEPRALPEGVA